ncbi:OmpA family protein [Aestuariibius sp. HNIBRBA575]|uniref:OmpA family protein n=1 Tax=Aestuariibius sp. HNIBRBA575 TaxID=3233343 RepID=UPI0034A1F67D
MRLSSVLIPFSAFVIAAFASGIAGRIAVGSVEERSVVGVREALADEGQGWVSVLADGLQVILEGDAPSEAVRFRVITIAGKVVDASRVIDNMDVQDTAGIEPPAFAMEILRNDGGVSLIGLIPADTDRDALNARIQAIAAGLPVTDLLEMADYPVPTGWGSAMGFALSALEDLPRSKISVDPGHVAITAISDSADQRRQLESMLSRNAPDRITMDLEISAPRPVISPFTTRFILDDRGARFDACAADTAQARDQIIAAATAAGLEGQVSCTLALGVPSRAWGDAVAMSVASLGEMGGGMVTISDADITLVAQEGVPQAVFDRVVGELENAVPDVFAVDATLPVTPDATEEGPPQFTITLSPEGLVQLRGKVSGELLNITAENYAKASFSGAQVVMGTRMAEDLPASWTIRVLAGIEALSNLADGAVIVEPTNLSVRGNTGNADANEDISRLLISKLGEAANFSVDVTYVERLDPIAALPSPEECIEKITQVSADRKITFEPGSATIDAGATDVVDDIAEILRACSDLRIRIAGYTDSQGREEMNQQLSKQRAEAVLTALRVRRVPTNAFVAEGFGEADPIADNDTEEGREANRRIEFSLIVPEPVEEVVTGLEAIEAPLADAADTPTTDNAQEAEEGTNDEQN